MVTLLDFIFSYISFVHTEYGKGMEFVGNAIKVENATRIDELKRIEKQEDRYETDGDNVMQILGIWNSIKTEQLLELISKLDRVRRVGGAWAMLIANPCLISAIYAVYDRIVDSFDNDDLYMQSVFFLMRAVMQMNSDECEEEKR